MADLSAGYHLALGIMIALFERERSGRGQWVQTSLLEAQLAMMDFQAARYLIADDVPGQAGNNHPTSIPTGVFATRDGQVNIQAAADHLFQRLCRAINAESLLSDERFTTMEGRLAHRDELNALLKPYIAAFSSAEIVHSLADIGVPCGPIYSVNQTFADPQVQTLSMTPEFEHARLGTLKLLGQSIKLNRTSAHTDRPTPEQGQHSDEILRELVIPMRP